MLPNPVLVDSRQGSFSSFNGRRHLREADMGLTPLSQSLSPLLSSISRIHPSDLPDILKGSEQPFIKDDLSSHDDDVDDADDPDDDSIQSMESLEGPVAVIAVSPFMDSHSTLGTLSESACGLNHKINHKQQMINKFRSRVESQKSLQARFAGSNPNRYNATRAERQKKSPGLNSSQKRQESFRVDGGKGQGGSSSSLNQSLTLSSVFAHAGLMEDDMDSDIDSQSEEEIYKRLASSETNIDGKRHTLQAPPCAPQNDLGGSYSTIIHSQILRKEKHSSNKDNNKLASTIEEKTEGNYKYPLLKTLQRVGRSLTPSRSGSRARKGRNSTGSLRDHSRNKNPPNNNRHSRRKSKDHPHSETKVNRSLSPRRYRASQRGLMDNFSSLKRAARSLTPSRRSQNGRLRSESLSRNESRKKKSASGRKGNSESRSHSGSRSRSGSRGRRGRGRSPAHHAFPRGLAVSGHESVERCSFDAFQKDNFSPRMPRSKREHSPRGSFSKKMNSSLKSLRRHLPPTSSPFSRDVQATRKGEV